ACELSCFDDRPVRNFLARRITHHDMRTGIVACVHPEIVRLCHTKGEIVVVARCASDQNLVAVGGKITTHAADLLWLSRFLLLNLWRRFWFLKTIQRTFVSRLNYLIE